MSDTDMAHFFSSEEIFQKADFIFKKEKENIEKLLPVSVDIQHIGSCSIPGALSKFDVDIQIRVKESDFKTVIEYVGKDYDKKHEELWKDGLSIFFTNRECKIDIVVTVMDSKYDDYYQVRDYMIAHPEMLEKYNSLKKSFEWKSISEYKKAKREFLGSNGNVKFLQE